ncbi:MAG: carboxypeptidase M32 [Myxococcales bacterium]|nr:carboxypeptidase M32 [Myxococcales bacterium]
MHPPLFARMQELRDLTAVIGLASWDQETYLPRKGDVARAAQLATLQGLYHERLVDPRLGEWLDSPHTTGDDEVAMVRVLKKERLRAVKIPGALVKALAEAQSKALSGWRAARDAQSFAVFRPFLERLVALRQEQADAWGHEGERYDALLEGFEPGMRVKRLLPVLEDLAQRLTPMVGKLEAAPKPRDIFAGKRFEVDQQWAFTMGLLEAMGFDLEAGRQDRSTHPFTSGAHPSDVRLTTRLFPESPLSAIFGTIHEGGHGLYEQGFPPELARTTLAQAPSMGLHESQSRLWENLVGRSAPFWTYFYPKLQATFSAQLGGVPLADFLRATNKVERSFIRVEADEVTYNLHIVLRTELELGLVRGELQVKDLEAAWNEKTKALLGLTVTAPTHGVLQDIHWAWGEFGYFPTYTLGNLYAASLWKRALGDITGLDAHLARGDLLPVRNWLREKIHRQGYRHEAEALIRAVTGQGLTDVDFVEALRSKYSALYGVAL